MTNVFDPKKPVRTREGQPVRIICTDRKSLGGYSLVGLVSIGEGGEALCARYPDGRFYEDRECGGDFVNVPQVKWLCCFDDGPGRVYHDTEKAATDAGKRSAGFICVVKVEFP